MINVLVSTQLELKAYVKNIGKGGICIVTEEPLAKGKLLKLVFSLPDSTNMRVNGRVIWSLPTDEGEFENGIDFLSLGKNYIKRLSDYLN